MLKMIRNDVPFNEASLVTAMPCLCDLEVHMKCCWATNDFCNEYNTTTGQAMKGVQPVLRAFAIKREGFPT